MVEGSQGFIAIAEYSGSVMVQVCGVVNEVSTCHMSKLLRVGSNDFVSFFFSLPISCPVWSITRRLILIWVSVSSLDTLFRGIAIGHIDMFVCDDNNKQQLG